MKQKVLIWFFGFGNSNLTSIRFDSTNTPTTMSQWRKLLPHQFWIQDYEKQIIIFCSYLSVLLFAWYSSFCLADDSGLGAFLQDQNVIIAHGCFYWNFFYLFRCSRMVEYQNWQQKPRTMQTFSFKCNVCLAPCKAQRNHIYLKSMQLLLLFVGMPRKRFLCVKTN